MDVHHYVPSFMTKDNGQDNYLAIMDIDDFKKVNDTYGHNCGDYVLKEIAQLIKKYSKGGFVCRWGGEEFIILGSVEIDMKNQCRILNDIRKFVGFLIHSFFHSYCELSQYPHKSYNNKKYDKR